MIPKFDLNYFIKNSKKIHNNKYDYSLSDYVNIRTKVKIICPIHGKFEQVARHHLRGNGCIKCGNITKSINTSKDIKDFIKDATTIHANKYNYSLVKYVNSKTKIKIICPEHGVFEQSPNHHINQKQGCPICRESKGEKTIKALLTQSGIKFISQKRFINCRNIRPLPFDFYLSDYNICVEYDGEQHFRNRSSFGDAGLFNKIVINDAIKTKFCKQNNIKLIRIKYNQNVSEVFNKLIKSFILSS